MKILTVVGARPQFVKAAVVSREIARHNATMAEMAIQEVIVHTGQHYDQRMSDVFFKEMQIPKPQHHLGIGGSSHGAMTGQMMEKIEAVLLDEKPDVLQVYGDTNSTLAGALAAAKLHIPIAHVEAGLRSFNMGMPEEVNRILTDQVSTWLFCPTETACKNLTTEGLDSRQGVKISQVGDVMYDAAQFYRKIAQPTDAIQSLLDTLPDRYYLSTVHRAENTDDPQRLESIMHALDEISSVTPVVLPLHPRTQKILQGHQFHHLRIIDPVGYFDMITLLANCDGVLTDSGGLQKEAYFFHQPCVTLRDETEWIELVQHGLNTLVGANRNAILQAEETFLRSSIDFSQVLYGNGDAAAKIIEQLLNG